MTMFTILDGQRIPVASIEDAVKLWESHRDNHPVYGYAGCSEVGNGIVVFRDNRSVAKISYNSRVWPI